MDLWSISFSKIHKDYNDWVNKKKKKRPELKNISLKQIKNIVNKLKDLGLLIIENVKKRNCYFLPLPNKLPNNENITIPDTTSIEGNQATPRYIRNNNIDIDSNSNSKEFNADMYEKCTSLVDVRNKVKELLKAARVKSSWIKNKVLTKLSENYRNITVKFLESYINTVIIGRTLEIHIIQIIENISRTMRTTELYQTLQKEIIQRITGNT